METEGPRTADNLVKGGSDWKIFVGASNNEERRVDFPFCGAGLKKKRHEPKSLDEPWHHCLGLGRDLSTETKGSKQPAPKQYNQMKLRIVKTQKTRISEGHSPSCSPPRKRNKKKQNPNRGEGEVENERPGLMQQAPCGGWTKKKEYSEA